MRSVNIHEAKTHLSRLLDEVAAGESLVIAKAGKPKAKLVPISQEKSPVKSRIGFMKGAFQAPDDIKTPFAEEIEEMFYGSK